VENQDLLEIFQQSTSSEPTRKVARDKVEIPPELVRAMGETKLSRQDRKWEAELAQEAIRRSWEFWQHEVSAEIHDVERYARCFSESLWPRGAVLFIESDGFLKVSDKDPNQAYWRGRWFVIADPKSSSVITAKENQQPEAVDPKWQRLYPLQ
jgi:hypothetical protein